jgi:hypothetical protein
MKIKTILFALLSLNLFENIDTFKIIKLISRNDVINTMFIQSTIANCFVQINKNKIKNYVDNKNLILNNKNITYDNIVSKTIKKYNNDNDNDNDNDNENKNNTTELLTYNDIMTKTYLFYFVLNTIISLLVKAYFNFLKSRLF